MKKKKIRYILGPVIIFGAMLSLITIGTKSNTLRAVPVAELRVADSTAKSMVSQRLRVVGFVGKTPVRKTELRTPPITAGALEGITRDAVMQIAEEIGVLCVERDIALFDIYSADEAFLTGTAAEVVPMTMLDSRSIGDGKPGAITQQIMARYSELTRSEGDSIFD